jgi:hypothetical protein
MCVCSCRYFPCIYSSVIILYRLDVACATYVKLYDYDWSSCRTKLFYVSSMTLTVWIDSSLTNLGHNISFSFGMVMVLVTTTTI